MRGASGNRFVFTNTGSPDKLHTTISNSAAVLLIYSTHIIGVPIPVNTSTTVCAFAVILARVNIKQAVTERYLPYECHPW